MVKLEILKSDLIEIIRCAVQDQAMEIADRENQRSVLSRVRRGFWVPAQEFDAERIADAILSGERHL